MTLLVFCSGNHFDAQAVAYKRCRQISIFAIMNVSISQYLVANLAEDLLGIGTHPEIDAVAPFEFELLTTPDEWHGDLHFE
jgi:hypothetical protein